jgi:F-type H+-transporting ATPase subunit b
MRAESDAAKAKLGEEAAKLAAERAETLQQAVSEAGKEKAALIAAARSEADKLRTEARAEIERLREGEETETADRASRLAADIAAKLFARLPDEARISGFIDGLAEGVASLPETTRNELGADGSALRLKAARTLTDAEAEACRAKLSAVLGRRVEIAAEADPSLLAGLELDAPHAIVRNSFRADLDRIVAELTRHGG